MDESISGIQIDVLVFLRLHRALNGAYFKVRRMAKVKCTYKKDGGRESAVIVGRHMEVCSLATLSTLFRQPKEKDKNVS